MNLTYDAIKNLTNEELKEAYHELKVGLPIRNKSIVRRTQSALYYENGCTVAMVKVQYRIAMEMLERFYEN